MLHTLLVIDLQNGFLTEASQHIIEPIRRLQNDFENVIFTKFSNPPGSPFRKILDYHKMTPGSEETDLVLVPRPDAALIERPHYSCVTPELKKLLQSHGATEVYICGIATEACVMTSAIELFELGVRPYVISDLCASDKGEGFHQSALTVLRKLINPLNVITSEAIAARRPSSIRVSVDGGLNG